MLRLKSIFGAENIYQSCGKGINKNGEDMKKRNKQLEATNKKYEKL